MPTLEEISKQVVVCQKCPLGRVRTNAVPGEGSPKAEVMFIGEGPGQVEDEQGRPFVGPAGKLLDELLMKIGLPRSQVYIANVIKCRPPGNRDPLPDELETCFPYLAAQIQIIHPKLIVILGRHALERFLPGYKISQVHGQPKRRKIENVGTYVFYPTFHPAAALHQDVFRKPLEEDFDKLLQVLKKAKELPDSVPMEKEEKKDEITRKPSQSNLGI